MVKGKIIDSKVIWGLGYVSSQQSISKQAITSRAFFGRDFFLIFTHRRRESICLTEGAVSHGPNELDALPQTDLGNDATSTSGTEKLRSRCVVDLFCSYIKCTCLNVDIHSNIGTHVNTH